MKYINNKQENIEYRKRPGSYAIIIREEDNKIGIIKEGTKNFFLGGGIEKNETELDALKREAVEELGYTIKNIQEFDKVGSFIFSLKRGYLEVIANVYIAELDEKVKEPIEEDHKLIWVNAKDYIKKMYRNWQQYILEEFNNKF